MAHADILGQEGTALSRLATVSNPVHSPNSASWSFAEDYIAPSPDVAEARELLQVLAKKQAGDTVKLGVLRDRDKLDVDVTLKRRNELFEER